MALNVVKKGGSIILVKKFRDIDNRVKEKYIGSFGVNVEFKKLQTEIHELPEKERLNFCKNLPYFSYEGSIKNKDCPIYLGVHVAEHVLSHVFKNVKRMPLRHKGYDFLCSKDYMIDVKSACRRVQEKQADGWQFMIKKNTIADYFLCLAFDNRESLNPEHIWLIPGKDVNDKTGTSISETRLEKWDCYKLDKIKEIINCCNILRL